MMGDGTGARGVVVAIREMVVNVAFDDELPDIHELLIVDSPNRTILLVENLYDGQYRPLPEH